MDCKTSFTNAILEFAFTGVLAPHAPRGVAYAPPRVVSTAARQPFRPQTPTAAH